MCAVTTVLLVLLHYEVPKEATRRATSTCWVPCGGLGVIKKTVASALPC
jgi:hypothetical protein